MYDVSADFCCYTVMNFVMPFTPLSDEGVCSNIAVYPTSHVLKNLGFFPSHGEKSS
jgi:hypothetical protein